MRRSTHEILVQRLAARVFAFGFAFMLIALAIPQRAFAASSSLERVKSTGVLRWGGDVQGGEPYAYADPQYPEKMKGFEVDLAAALARELGVRDEFHQNEWSSLEAALERGSFDIILSGLEVTAARKNRLALTRPYYVFAERLMARKSDTSITPNLASLRGRRVGTLNNSLAFELLRGSAEVSLYEGTAEPYIDLEGGRTDAVLLDDIIADRYGVPNKALRVVGDVAEGSYAVGIPQREGTLKAALDAALGRIIESGELRSILEKEHVWNERQAKLRDGAEVITQTPDAPTVTTQGFGFVHLKLFLRGAVVTFAISLAAMVIAVAMGLALALARVYGGPTLAFLARAYVEIYRGTPLLLQLYLIYFGLASFVNLGAWPAAILGLGMNYAAYEAEVYRAGLQAVPPDQMEAAVSLGMSTRLALRRVVLPQAVRNALPNITNDFIALLKDSSLVSVITLVELTKQMTITAVDVRSWMAPGIACAALYFLMSYPLGVLSRHLEKRLEGRVAAESETVAAGATT